METITKALSGFLGGAMEGLGQWAPKLLGALIALIIGLWIIRMVMKAVSKVFETKHIDETLRPFLLTLLGFSMKAMLFISIAGVVGIPIAAFSALIAAAGLAIGLAFQGSLGHLASGVMLLIFKPFKVGDLVEVDGELGFVQEISVFVTIMTTFQNKTAIIPNGTITSGKIVNYSKIGNVRADIPFAIRYDADQDKAQEIVMTILKNSNKVLQTPAPSVYITDLGDSAVHLIALPYCTVEDYWDVFWGLRGEIKKQLGENGFEAPFQQRVITQK